MKVGVVGAGINGLISAYALAKCGVKVVIYEKEHYIGGHAKTVAVDGVELDLGFIIFNRVSYKYYFFCLFTRLINCSSQPN